MTYIPETVFEARASELWQKYGLKPAFDIEELADQLGLGLLWEEVPDTEDSVVLGLLDPIERRIVLNERHLAELEAKGGRLGRYTMGHEIAHWIFHADAARSGTLSLVEGSRVWCRSGSKDPAERQAEMFSARLLVPRDQLRELVPKTSWRGWRHVYALADRFAVSPMAMVIRFEELRWGHRDESGEPVSGPPLVPGQEQLFS